jgi:glycosyltransferase involved in cell wall biosynthesis
MNKIKTDAIVGFKYNKTHQGEMFGKSRVFYKTSEKLRYKVDYNVIGHMESNLNNNLPLKNFIHDFVGYPRMVKDRIRTDTDLIHVFSQEEAYLLKFLKKINVSKVVSCLDIIPLIFQPKITSYTTRFLRSTNILKSDAVRLQNHLKNADRIITISDNTKNDLIQHLKISPEKIQTIYLGVDENFTIPTKTESDLIKQKYSLPESYILYLGSEQPRKNFPFLLKSFYKLKKAHDLPKLKLLKVGRPQIGLVQHNEIIKLIKELNIENEVIFIDHIPDKDLTAVYNAASVFVYPSLYEGFGLPPLEAMSCGCPVITSNTSSLPEVVGNAGIMVDPNDVDLLCDKMYQILSNDSLGEELRKKGLNRAKLFNWDKTASETLRIYEEIIS